MLGSFSILFIYSNVGLGRVHDLADKLMGILMDKDNISKRNEV